MQLSADVVEAVGESEVRVRLRLTFPTMAAGCLWCLTSAPAPCLLAYARHAHPAVV